MKVAPVYRRVLKQLHTACHTRPHYVQDIRFLLSLPLYRTGDSTSTVVPGTTSTSRRVHPSPRVCKPSVHATKSSTPSSCKTASRDPVEEHLQRPSSECLSIDTTTLFAMCFTDLHNALHESVPVATGMNSVAIQIMRYRNLLWLQQRLARVLSSKTKQLLATSLSISSGPTEQDFIPDDFFQKKSSRSGGATPSAALSAQKTGAAAASGDDRLAEAGSATTTMSQSTAEATSIDPTASSAPAPAGRGPVELVEESDPDIVYSAGAIGQQQEVFALRHREAFPMAAQFLAGFPTVTAAELATCAFQQAALTQLVREKFPTRLTCHDASVSLSVSVEPYDVEYTNKEHAGIGYFAAAHRQFRVRFSLVPLSHEETGAERAEVLVVNSYFVRLDMELMQLVEEVGYLHSSDVLRMLRERDYGDHFSEFIGSGVAEVLGEGVFTALSEGEGSTAAAATEKKTGEQPSATVAEGSRVFSLYFANYSDAPMVLKGILYYKLGKRRHLARAPIRCIPFGFLLMES
ncbi:hypothetical protein LSCM1_01028 [Leishmania martiniquensis]|uniref:Uncharacterized protein n=1 Tax=Leishmania martiniquensis TaxID=1580590 RepID=A0A836KAW6_9TRYP|nr:hypothetical protein LSCM1_01028 [Leishmania martiniquensis]